MYTLSVEARAKIDRRLNLNEQLLWAGKPIPKGFSKGMLGVMVFGFIWLGLSLFIGGLMAGSLWFGDGSQTIEVNGRETMVSELSVWVKVSITSFFIPFIFIGIGFVFLPLWRRLWSAGLIYAITTKRVMRVGRLRTTSWRVAECLEPDRVDYRNGTTDIFIAYSSILHNGRAQLTGLINLPTHEAAGAEAALRRLLEDAPATDEA